MLLPSALHLVTVWPFGKKGKKTSCLGISKNCLSLPTLVTSAIPPEPLFSLLTNIPQVTFPICLKSDSLTGVSVGNLGNSQCAVTFTVETDGKNWDLEISLGYYDLAQRLGTRGSGRTNTLYLSPNMRLSSDAINQSRKSMFCSGRPKSHTHSSWFLNWAGNSDPLFPVGVC